MTIFSRKKFQMLLVTTALAAPMVLAGVAMAQVADGAKQPRAEDLLNAEGNWNLVDETSNDPALAHQRARENVDTQHFKRDAALAPHFTPDAKSGQDGKMRVLKLQPNGDDAMGDLADEGLAVTETSITKPSQKVVKPELATKVRALLAEKSQAPSPAYEAVSSSGLSSKEQAPSIAGNASPSVGTGGEVRGFFDRIANALTPDAPPEIKVEPAPAAKPIIKTQAPKGILASRPLDIDTQQIQTAEQRISPNGIAVPPSMPVRKVERVYASAAPQVAVTPRVKPSTAPLHKSALTSKSGAQDLMSVDALQNGVVRALGMRSAMHPGKTRIAFDFSDSVKYKVALDHIRNVLRVKFENAKWGLEPQGSLEKNSALLGSYVTKQQKDGSILFEVRLRQKVSLDDTMIIRPGTSPHHRVVIDLKS